MSALALAVATLTFAPAIRAQCISLATSQYCSEFSAFSVARAANNVQPDQFISQTNGTNSLYVNYIHAAPYNCPSWDGTGTRYIQTVSCGWLLSTAASHTCNNGKTVPPVCGSTAQIVLSSFKTIFANTQQCPGTSHAIEATLLSYLNSLTGDPAGCIATTKGDLKMCGFSHVSEIVTYCG
eukprot:jgi/Hompol1/2263/HPOL_005916-RA